MKVGVHRAKQEAWGELRGTGCHTPGVKACPQNLSYPVGMPNTAPSPALFMAWQEQSGRVWAHSLEKGLIPGIAVQPGHASGRRSVPPVQGWLGGSQAPWQHFGALTLLPQARQPPLHHPSGCCLVNWEEKKHERSGSTGLLISPE